MSDTELLDFLGGNPLGLRAIDGHANHQTPFDIRQEIRQAIARDAAASLPSSPPSDTLRGTCPNCKQAVVCVKQATGDLHWCSDDNDAPFPHTCTASSPTATTSRNPCVWCEAGNKAIEEPATVIPGRRYHIGNFGQDVECAAAPPAQYTPPTPEKK